MPQTVEEMEKIEAPDWTDVESAKSFLASLAEHEGRYGVTMLRKEVQHVINFTEARDKHIQNAMKHLNSVNGIRSQREDGWHGKAVARQFFKSLNGEGLKKQCRIYTLNYDMFDNQDELIDALVDRYVEMQGE